MLVHGFSILYPIWDPVFVSLLEGGFRVLQFDLYSRGTSDRPGISDDRDLFDCQLLDLFDILRLENLVDSIGLSLGGSISAIFYVRHLEWIRRLVLIDPPGFQLKTPIWTRLLMVPHLGEWIFRVIGEKMVMGSMIKNFYAGDGYPEFVEVVRQQMNAVGYRQSLLSTIREGMLGEIYEIYWQIGGQKQSVLLIRGIEDRLNPFKNRRDGLRGYVKR